MPETSLTPASTVSLYDLEQNLQALLDTSDMVSPELEAEYRAELAKVMTESLDKRNRVYQFLRALDLSSKNCAEEIKRLQARRKMYSNTEDRMYDYILRVVESLGVDAKGKPKSLKCDYCTFSIRNTPSRVEIVDAPKVPAEFKTMTVTMPMTQWEALLATPGVDADALLMLEKNVEINTARIGAEIAAGRSVEGADMRIGEKNLQVR